MDEFPARDSDTLFRRVLDIPWENLIPEDGRFPVLAGTVKSVLRSEPNTQKTVKKAIALRLGEAYGKTSMPETGALFTVRVNILKDICTVTVDTTGESLHKRGYRARGVAAPVKETLAAALLELSFWKPGRPLVDPCAGSGTIMIEAAMIGRNMAPGLFRHFAAEEWRAIPAFVWKNERKAAYLAQDTAAELDIRGCDIDRSAVERALLNIEKAGVTDCISMEKRDIADFLDAESLPPGGVIVTNPPYGERVGTERSVLHVEKALADFFRKRPDWSLFVITSDKDFESKVMGRRADRRRKLYNGRIEVTYYQFHGIKPAKQNCRAQEASDL